MLCTSSTRGVMPSLENLWVHLKRCSAGESASTFLHLLFPTLSTVPSACTSSLSGALRPASAGFC